MSDRLYTGPIIEMHIHAHTRSTDDLRALKEAGVVALVEPAFWSGIDKRFPQSFFDYFSEIMDFEYGDMPYGSRRCHKFGLQHFTFLGVNAKEAENSAIVDAVLEMTDDEGDNLFEQYLDHPRNLGVGEIGLNKNTPNEIAALRRQFEIARDRNDPVIIHTPHDYSDKPEDRYKLAGTEIIIGLIRDIWGEQPVPFIDVDHATEETIEMILGLPGAYAGFTLYPTKMSIERVIALLQKYPGEYDRFLINSSADWDDSVPLAVPHAAETMMQSGFTEQQVRKLVYDNPNRFLSQSPKYRTIMDL